MWAVHPWWAVHGDRLWRRDMQHHDRLRAVELPRLLRLQHVSSDVQPGLRPLRVRLDGQFVCDVQSWRDMLAWRWRHVLPVHHHHPGLRTVELLRLLRQQRLAAQVQVGI